MLPAYDCGFVAGVAPQKGSAVVGAKSDNLYPPNHPESEEVDQETCRKTNRMSQNLVRPDGQISEITESHPKMNGVPPNPRWGPS